MLESLFAIPPLADDGFSAQVVRKIQRRIWVRRLTVPVAGTIGGVIAFKPLAALASVVANLSEFIPKSFIETTTGSIPQMQVLVLGALLLGACLLGLRLMED